MIKLGVNLDHVATVRQARRTVEPDPVRAAVLAEQGGADNITVHLRGDRRHIQDRDLRLLRETITGLLNLEMALGDEVLEIACTLAPQWACLVPERRAELTTEGGLKVAAGDAVLGAGIGRLHDAGVRVSLFIDPEPAAVQAAKTLGAEAVELHTGTWAEAWLDHHQRPSAEQARRLRHELARLEAAAAEAAACGIELHAGHGITYRNVRDLLHLPLLTELNIGHSIISRALFTGLQQAVADMKRLIEAGPA
jgi:pyridoxine 5-phosphate synthase